MSPREDVLSKAKRYVGEGRLQIIQADSGSIIAACRGQGAEYTVSFMGGEWRCTCPARTICAHIRGLQLVFTPTRSLLGVATLRDDMQRPGSMARPEANAERNGVA